jgi:hypothetical protein
MKQADWQHVANSLLRQFTIITEPLSSAALMSLATCSTFLPQAIDGETSFCVQLRDDTPDTPLDGEISYTKTYSHDMPIRFDGDDYRIEFEEATYPEDEDTTLTVWLRWEPKQQPPYDGVSGLAKCENSNKDGAFAAVRARMHCLFLDPQPQLTEVSSDGEAVLRTAFGEIPKHVFQGDGTGWGTSIGSNFGRAWSKNPPSRPIFVFIHLGSYRNENAFRRIVDAGPGLCLCELFGEEEARQDAPGISASSKNSEIIEIVDSQ